MKKILTIQVFVNFYGAFGIITEELYRMAKKAGSNYGASPLEDLNGDIEYPRDYWESVVNRLHKAIEDIEKQKADWVNEKKKQANVMLILDPDPDFCDFLKKELAAGAHRRAKDAFEEVGQSSRAEMIEAYSGILAKIRDQVVQHSSPQISMFSLLPEKEAA